MCFILCALDMSKPHSHTRLGSEICEDIPVGKMTLQIFFFFRHFKIRFWHSTFAYLIYDFYFPRKIPTRTALCPFSSDIIRYVLRLEGSVGVACQHVALCLKRCFDRREKTFSPNK
jgi:hypothetical protein